MYERKLRKPAPPLAASAHHAHPSPRFSGTSASQRYMTAMATSTPPNEMRSWIMKWTMRQPRSEQSCCGHAEKRGVVREVLPRRGLQDGEADGGDERERGQL